MLSRFCLYPLLSFLTLNLFVAASPISDQWDSLRHLDKIDQETRDWHWNRLYPRRCMTACRLVDYPTATATTTGVTTPSTLLDEAPTPTPTVSEQVTTTTKAPSSGSGLITYSPTGTIKAAAASSPSLVTPTSSVATSTTNVGKSSASMVTYVVSHEVTALSIGMVVTLLVLVL
ncbi:hypothetical protein JAAARDRAFT_209070 [Jaapia argillacea MUCL 33604]|uniref:Uncharacterized protein n=1 Tax=Jaapia argillacea MUCL 33604 TaxID=933084 RepID=A0A067PUA4_9AGAM|nr:hypothetical protein JAAARDRAFT_209070 [Jaapia argillacea MUCL 33604]